MKIKIKNSIFLVACFFLLTSCLNNSTSTTIGGSGSGGNVAGTVEKGPFTEGSKITIQYLDTTGTPQEETYESLVSNNLGEYSTVLPHGGMILVSVTGTYFDELAGAESDSEITLKAVYPINPERSNEDVELNLNMNVLTHLIHQRVIELMYLEGNSFSDANAVAQQELLSELSGVFASDVSTDFVNLSLFNKLGTDNQDNNAYLLASTSAIHQFLIDEAVSDVNVTINDVLQVLTEDFKSDGNFDDSNLTQDLPSIVNEIDPEIITDNLNILIQGESNISVADINEVLDTDLDGLVNNADDDIDGDRIPNSVDTDIGFGFFQLEGAVFNIDWPGSPAIGAKQHCESKGLILATWTSEAELGDLIDTCHLGEFNNPCFTQYKVNATTDGHDSIIDGSPMPSYFTYWSGSPLYTANRNVMVRWETELLYEQTAGGYAICVGP